jgi:hypothetical protein
MSGETGKYIVILGIVIVVIGAVIWQFHDKMTWIGRLPGDFRLEKPNFSFYFPVATMLLLSIVVTAIIWVIRKFF